MPAKPARRLRLGEILVKEGLINDDQLDEALKYQRAHGGRLGSVLVTMGHLDEQVLSERLGVQLGLQVCEVESINPPAEVLQRLPERLIRRYEMVPLSVDQGTMVIGMTDPHNFSALDDLRFVTGAVQVEVRLITESTFRRFLNTRFSTSMLLDQIAADGRLGQQEVGAGDDWETAGAEENSVEDEGRSDPPVVRLVNYLLLHAVEQRASDIHVEPYETFFRIRYRVDGRLYTLLTPPQRLHMPLISRVKVLAGMDIAVRRKPQDGHILLKVAEESVHFRVSNLPTVYGEKCVIRLLKKEAHLSDLGRLGFRPDQLKEVLRHARMPQGMMLVTGPTGSGKTTTLHALLNAINEPEVNIVTVEDPVESTIPGVNHVQIEERGGVTFAAALRSILRQDPDVVFVGEMRDEEVSRIAIKAAMTGHLVLSTLHTNGVLESFARLNDMNLEPYLLAGCLKMVLAQRLLRRNCAHCSKPLPISQKLVEEFSLNPTQVATAHTRSAVGCYKCMDTGYRGRVGVYESIVVDDAVASILRRGGSEAELKQAADERNTVWLYEAGIARALAGETTFDEVRRVLVEQN